MQKLFQKRIGRNKKGFTLVELVVVIAILGILAAIAVPRLIGFQDRARQQADNQTAAQVKNAVALLYANSELDFDTTPADVSFIVDDGASAGVVTLTYPAVAGGEIFTQTSAQVKALLETLITDFDLQSTRTILVTVDTKGAVSAVLQ